MHPKPPPPFKTIFDSDAWKETERKAAEAGAYWRKHFQTPTQRFLKAQAETERIRATHQGGKP